MKLHCLSVAGDNKANVFAKTFGGKHKIGTCTTIKVRRLSTRNQQHVGKCFPCLVAASQMLALRRQVNAGTKRLLEICSLLL